MLATAALWLGTSAASAAVLYFYYPNNWEGAGPQNPSPWAVATLTSDAVSLNVLHGQIVLSSFAPANVKMFEFGFNWAGAVTTGAVTVTGDNNPSVSFNEKADGDGYYAFTLKNSTPGAALLNAPGTYNFTITGEVGKVLSPGYFFDYGSAPNKNGVYPLGWDPKEKSYLAEMHLGPDDTLANSWWAYGVPTPPQVVPEASTIIAGALLLLPFGVSTIRRMRK